ncbi:glycosyltransferase [Pseudoalteromonas sp. C2R02]|uniref:glycosyltransferase family 2 protein n=1 Tax=Pseudoalteromonas sp. C2R02 TaxID=2841565 RepID=UPI001C08DF17|nr:glycosyltransferase family 2 protein [Pseudoalteromonas sp. C2R02]MBU2971764.1 glycosyltransferase [Pseudoalteromonas sp. C2R02]
MNNLVSVIMPTYNSSKTLFASVQSVLSQIYTDWELLIVDDCSSDNTWNLIQELADSDSRIKVFQNESNLGAGGSRNKAIEQAKGRYIAFLDSDDKWCEHKLEKQITFMKENKVAFSYTGYQKFNSEGLQGKVIPPEFATYKKLLVSNYIGCLTVIYDKFILGKHYMPLIRKRQDFGLWLKLLKQCGNAQGIPEILAYYSVDTGMTQNKFNILKWQWIFYRNELNLSFIKTAYIFPIYAYKGIFKSLK